MKLIFHRWANRKRGTHHGGTETRRKSCVNSRPLAPAVLSATLEQAGTNSRNGVGGGRGDEQASMGPDLIAVHMGDEMLAPEMLESSGWSNSPPPLPPLQTVRVNLRLASPADNFRTHRSPYCRSRICADLSSESQCLRGEALFSVGWSWHKGAAKGGVS
jgi:hypothetical protein